MSNTNENKALYIRDMSERALEECFKRCAQSDKKDYKSVSNRQQTCICTSTNTQSTAPSSSPTLTPTPTILYSIMASTVCPRANSKPSHLIDFEY